MRRCVLILGTLLACACSALAQPVFRTYQSLEFRALRAKAIFRGVVESAQGEFIERPGGFFGGRRPDGTLRPDGVMRQTVTIRVSETLKGTVPTLVTFTDETMADDRRFDAWAARKTEFLFFVDGGATSNLRGYLPSGEHVSTIRLGEAVPEEKIFTSDIPVVLTDGTVVTGRERILAEVREAIRTLPSTRSSHTLPTGKAVLGPR